MSTVPPVPAYTPQTPPQSVYPPQPAYAPMPPSPTASMPPAYYEPRPNEIYQPQRSPASRSRPIRTEMEDLQRRWFPKQVFNTNAPPKDQIASPWRFAVLSGATFFLMPTMALPVTLIAYLWQNQRNANAQNQLREERAKSSENDFSSSFQDIRSY